MTTSRHATVWSSTRPASSGAGVNLPAVLALALGPIARRNATAEPGDDGVEPRNRHAPPPPQPALAGPPRPAERGRRSRGTARAPALMRPSRPGELLQAVE